ncbi:hypothetical protein KQI86_17500 [Clostridium sp. MSJ-11]|uniref:ATP synthase F1 complex delta/epsilon subunit N-terminal domain-containing protein n=1 Tax=Clostridium mobile TaxID=2841512 RepID=A0ABS6ENZ7_9CLOT|nr:hypothetical protein [Clostridium mobile]MBU5486115.1 hypothetical protein [Clostridium mobile]
MFKLIIASPYKEFYNLDVKKLVTESLVGRIEILQNHSPLIAVLRPSNTEFEDINGKTYSFNISKALMKVTKEEVKILCENMK